MVILSLVYNVIVFNISSTGIENHITQCCNFVSAINLGLESTREGKYTVFTPISLLFPFFFFFSLPDVPGFLLLSFPFVSENFLEQSVRVGQLARQTLLIFFHLGCLDGPSSDWH